MGGSVRFVLGFVMFMFSCLLFCSFFHAVCFMLPLPSCLHAIGSLVLCVTF